MSSAAPARSVSASELYSGDEVELLLEEIRGLEPTACRGEELADLEIAGSGAARSPAPTERSWDSHAGYGRRGVGLEPRVALYCGRGGVRAAAAALLLAAGGAAAALVLAAGGLRARRPPPLRLLLLAVLLGALAAGTLLAALLAGLAPLLPLRRVARLAAAVAAALTLLASLVALHAVLTDMPPNSPPHYSHLYLSATGLCAFMSCVWAALAWGVRQAPSPHAYRAVPRRAPPA